MSSRDCSVGCSEGFSVGFIERLSSGSVDAPMCEVFPQRQSYRWTGGARGNTDWPQTMQCVASQGSVSKLSDINLQRNQILKNNTKHEKKKKKAIETYP